MRQRGDNEKNINLNVWKCAKDVKGTLINVDLLFIQIFLLSKWLKYWLFKWYYVLDFVYILTLFKGVLETDNIEANFFTQQEGTEVKTHVDVGTPCAINFIISGAATPIIFEEGGTHYYQNALLDVSKRHSVPKQVETERLLFKLRILDHTFEEAQKKIIEFFEY